MPIYEYQGQQYDIATDDKAAAKTKILTYLESQGGAKTPATAPPGERTWGEAAADIGAGAVSGVGKLIQFPGQMYGLATGAIGDKDFGTTGVQGVGQNMQDWAKEQESPELKRRVAATEAKVKTAEKTGGQWEAFKTQFWEVIKDPVQLGAFLAEQLPGSLPSMIAAIVPGAGPALAAEVKALQAAAQVATTVAAKQAAETALGVAVKNATASAVKRGTAASVATGATQQGTDVGTDTFEQNYAYLVKQGVPAEEAAAQVINKARAAGLSGAIISLLAQKLPGAQAMERALAGEKGNKGRVVGAILGAAKETPGEIVEEVGGKFTQNLAAREFNPQQSLTEGLGQTGASAALGASFLGGTIGAVQQNKNAPTPPSTKQPSEQQPLPPTTPASGQQTLEEVEKAEIEQITQDLLKQNFPEANARSIATRRVVENRSQQTEAVSGKSAQEEIAQRVQELIDVGVDPKLAAIQAPQQIAAEHEADALAQSEAQGEPNANQPIPPPIGASDAALSATAQPDAAAGLGDTQRDGVVLNQQDASVPNGGETAQPAAVAPVQKPKRGRKAAKAEPLAEPLAEPPINPTQGTTDAQADQTQQAESPAPTQAAEVTAPVEIKRAKSRAPGGGRKALTPEAKAAKEAQPKPINTTTINRQVSTNKSSLLSRLDAVNAPIDESKITTALALEDELNFRTEEKRKVVAQLVRTEEKTRGTAVGKRIKAVLDDRNKISLPELTTAKQANAEYKKQNAAPSSNAPQVLASTSGQQSVGKVDVNFSGLTNGAQALTQIIKTGNRFQKFLAARLRPFVAKIKFVVIEKDTALPPQLQEYVDFWNGSRGLFIGGTGDSKPTVYVRGASFGQYQGANNVTVLHELLHAATSTKIDLGMQAIIGRFSKDAALTRFTGDLTLLMRDIKTAYERMLDTGDVSTEVQALVDNTDGDIFNSPHEFLAYGMSDGNFQYFLDSIPSKFGRGSGWSRFVDAIAKVFGLGHGNYSALSDLMYVTDNILSAKITPAMRAAEAVENQPLKSAKTPDDPVRSAAELNRDVAVALETVAVSRAGGEGKGIEMLQMARDPSKVMPILQTLAKRNWLNMNHGAIAQLVKMPTMTFLAKWSGIKSLQDVDTLMQSMLGMSNSLQAAAGNMLNSFKKELNPLFRGAKEFRTDFENLVYTTTVARIDPSNPKSKETHPAITALWGKVGPKGQAMYRQLKTYYENLVDFYSDLLDEQVKAIKGMTPEAKANLMKVLRQTFETGSRITPYFPLVRRGDYWLSVSEKVGKETVQAYYMFESVGERDQYASQLAAEKLDTVDNLSDNGTFDMGNTLSSLRMKNQDSSAMLTQIFDAIDQEKFDSPQAKEALKDSIYQVYLNTMPEQKFRSQFIHRKDRAGFSTDILRNIAATATSTSRHLAKLKYSPLLSNALSAANDVAKTDARLSPFVTEANERVKLALEGGKVGMGDAVAGLANKASFFWFLSGASSAIIQPASVYIAALPILGANHGNVLAAAKELGKMLVLINQYSTTRENSDGTVSLVAPSIANNTSLPADERDAIRQMGQRGVTQSTYASEVYGYKSTSTAGASTVLGKTKELGVEAADLLIGSLMHNTERLTREAVFLASYRLGVKRKLSPDEAINQAVNDVNESLGNYDVTNRPRIMQQGLGKVLLQFKMFPLHTSLLLATNFIQMLPLLNKEGKKAAATKFFGIYLTAGSLAGLAGIPMFTPIIGVVAAAFKAIQGDDADDELKDLDATTWFRSVLLPEKLGHITIGGINVADLLDSGFVNTLTGTAVAERVGLNDMFGRDTKEAKTSREGALAAMAANAGPTASLILSALDALDAFEVGDDAKAWDKLSPAAIRNIRYAMRLAEEGIKDSKGNEVVPADEVSTGRFLAQVVGFRPVEVARIAELNYKLTGAQIKIQNEQGRLLTSAKVAIRRQDDKGFDNFEKVMESIDAFNQRHPTFQMDMGDVMDSVTADMEKRSGAQLGFNIDEKNAVFSERVIGYFQDRLDREKAARKK